jgi:hypothetical protein
LGKCKNVPVEEGKEGGGWWARRRKGSGWGSDRKKRGRGGGAEAIGVMFSQGNRNTATTALQLGTHTHTKYCTAAV